MTIFPSNSVHFCFMNFEDLLDPNFFMSVLFSWWSNSFIISKCSPLSWSPLICYIIENPHYACCLHDIFFCILLLYILSVSFVSSICLGLFFIHLGKLYLLIGEFSPLLFDVIIMMVESVHTILFLFFFCLF